MPDLIFKKSAARYYSKLPSNIRSRLNEVFDTLAEERTDKLDIKALKGEFEGIYRIRAGNLRIFFEFTGKSEITILEIIPRGDAYKS